MKLNNELTKKLFDNSFRKVIKFRNLDYDLNSNKDTPASPPHYHIILPIQKEKYLVLVMCSSKVEKKQRIYKEQNELLNCLEIIEVGTLDFLDKKTVIDCNSPLYGDYDEILSKMPNADFELITQEVPELLIQSLIKKVKASPRVRPQIKKLL